MGLRGRPTSGDPTVLSGRPTSNRWGHGGGGRDSRREAINGDSVERAINKSTLISSFMCNRLTDSFAVKTKTELTRVTYSAILLLSLGF